MKSNSTLTSLYVGDLHPDVTEMMLAEMVSRAGPIHSVHVCRDKKTFSSRGYAFVNFLHRADAARALEMFDSEFLMGRPIRMMMSHKDPSMRNTGIRNLIIKNLDKSIDQASLFDRLSMFGKVLSCKVVSDEKGPKGYAYVQYQSPEAAELAIKKLNGKLLNDRQVFVEHVKVRERRETEAGPSSQPFTNVFIKNLAEDVNDRQLSVIFSKFGPLLNVHVGKDENGKSRGFGFVRFARHEDAQRAVTVMNGKVLNGKRVYVTRAQTKEERQAGFRQKFEQSLNGREVTNSRMWGRKPGYVGVAQKKDEHQVYLPPQQRLASVQRNNALNIRQPVPPPCSVPNSVPEMCRTKKSPAVDTVPPEESVPAAKNESSVESVPAVETAPVVVPVPTAKELQATTDAVPPTAVSPVCEVQPDKDTTDGPTSASAGKRLTIYMLESCPVDEQVQLAHGHLLPLVAKIHPNLANKITWMLVENQNNYEIVKMIGDPELLYAKVAEMDAILKAREAGLKPEAIKMLFGDKNKKRRKKNNKKNGF
ncbi:polyadenylate-binding protein 1-A-like [Neoarius graeffei]|uniref:polyadenylate-binding protein 1-A-like n=1 Tax=Neoarius graeffei TaxID=443677 RepID=UPI00298C2B2D|nr:polyadenylate-binding protein 1-A-like [Neoarius graeffei]